MTDGVLDILVGKIMTVEYIAAYAVYIERLACFGLDESRH